MAILDSLGQELLVEAYDNNSLDNIIISEPSLWQLLGLVINGASGTTRAEIKNGLLS